MQGLTKLVIVISKVNLPHIDTAADFCIKAAKARSSYFLSGTTKEVGGCVQAVAPGHPCLQEHPLNTVVLSTLQNRLKHQPILFFAKSTVQETWNCSEPSAATFLPYSAAKNNEDLSLHEVEGDQSETLRAMTLLFCVGCEAFNGFFRKRDCTGGLIKSPQTDSPV